MKVLLHLCAILGSSGAASVFTELERHATWDVPRYKVNKPRDGNGESIVPSEPDGDLYTDSLDMLALSQYIYELAALRNHARQTGDTDLLTNLDVSKEHPSCLGDLNKVIKANLHHIRRQDKAQEAVEALSLFFLSDFGEKEIAEGTKRNHDLHVFADDAEHTRSSRVYGIAVNEKKKRVEVVFRGTANVSLRNAWWDWSTNLNAFWRRKEQNPAKDNNRDTETIEVHRGFARVLLGSTKRIPRPIDKILQEDVKPLMQPGYKLYVSGHSLGGAIATLFGFYAASNPAFTQDGPVYVYTFASPRVGGADFRAAFTHLEKRGKLRHGRFHNKKDKVPQLPWLAGLYKHVGLEVRLRKEDPPVIDYPVEKTWKQAGQGLIHSLTSLPALLTYHSCDEMLRRLKRAKDAFLKSSLEHEYRAMWGI